MSLAELFHNVASGPRRRRELLTPLGLLVFGTSLLLVIAGGILIDRALEFALPVPASFRFVVGTTLLMSGCVLTAWCVREFRKARGTPVPFNPPTDLIVTGLYRWMRNPMLAGVFTALAGLGLLLSSSGMVLVTIPAYILLHVLELKLVEEPELERRFGDSYSEYRRQVPMFFPRFRLRRKHRAG